MIQIKLHDKSDFVISISLSNRILIMPKVNDFGYKKNDSWEKITFDVHFLFIKIYMFLWSRKVKIKL